MTRITTIGLMMLALAAGLTAAQEKQEPPKYDMHTFQMVVLKASGPLSPRQQADGSAFLDRMRSHAKAALVGPISGNGTLRAVLVLDVPSTAEAEAIVSADEALKSGGLSAEIHPWWAARNVIARTASAKPSATYFLGFLRRGPAWTPEVTPAIEELQKQHLANIRRLGETGKLVLAGPFSDDGLLRGVFIFFVPTQAEANRLAETDPAVRAGRLTIDLHAWELPVGALPPR